MEQRLSATAVRVTDGNPHRSLSISPSVARVHLDPRGAGIHRGPSHYVRTRYYVYRGPRVIGIRRDPTIGMRYDRERHYMHRSPR